MTPHERVVAALRGGRPDRVPFTCYAVLLPRGHVERQLREDGLALIERHAPFTTETPDVETIRHTFRRDGRTFVRETFRRPVGEVSQVFQTGGGYGTSLRKEFLVKTPDDYQVLAFIYRNQHYTPVYDEMVQAMERLGEDGVVIGNLGYSPMQQLIVMDMGTERFAIDWHERRDLVLELYQVINERRREQYELAAKSPAEFFIYGDNITSEIIGRERFERYALPCYNECAEVLHAEGKRLGVHMDGKMKHLVDVVATWKQDFVEAFAPFPDGDLQLADACRAWQGKVISINFPSAAHLMSEDAVADQTRSLLAASAPDNRFIVGITENIPDHVWQRRMPVISRVLREEGVTPH